MLKQHEVLLSLRGYSVLKLGQLVCIYPIGLAEIQGSTISIAANQ
jgi:hypothetical protein